MLLWHLYLSLYMLWRLYLNLHMLYACMCREVNGGCMVLSVDDDPINQMVVDNLLAPEGYMVEQVGGRMMG